MDESSDKRKEDLVFISYLEDNGEIISGYFELLKAGPAFVVFKSKSNEVSVPIHRVLKIKRRTDG